jgi:hypothetical protein
VEDVCDRAVIYYGGKIQASGELGDLLAERDSVRITMPSLPEPALAKVLDQIKHDVPEDKIQIDNPTQNLESYFINVVNEARKDETDTSGATSGSQVAEFLRGDSPVKTAADRKLERLAAPVSETETAPKLKEVSAPKVDDKKLTALTQAKLKPTKDEPADQDADKKTEADLAKANKKLSGLLGGDKKDNN